MNEEIRTQKAKNKSNSTTSTLIQYTISLGLADPGQGRA